MEDEDAELLREAAWQVYAVPPADFVATRTSWVKRLRGDGHRDLAKTVGALRKPSVSAAAVNALVRADDPVVQRLRDVGAKLRHAQSALDAAGLATLRGERDDLLGAWVGAARAHAPGGTLTVAVEGEVRSTAVAALADAEATEVVLSGSLTRALAYSGFGEVDVADAVARTSTGVVLTRIEGGRADPGPGTGLAQPESSPDDVADADDVAPDGETDEASDDVADEAPDGETDAAPSDAAVGAPDGETDAAPDDETDDGQDATAARESLARLREALDAAEAEVTTARALRREAADARTKADTEVAIAERGLEQARRLLARAEEHRSAAVQAQDEASTALAAADDTLATARQRRDTARGALEEAEDA